MKVRILGCGGAGGVPSLSAGWGQCNPKNLRNSRTRCAILVEKGDVRVLVDTPPDLRFQLLAAGVNRLDAVFYTHDHADHLHGIDDLREVNRSMKKSLNVYGTTDVLAAASSRFGYAFQNEEDTLGKESLYRPMLVPRPLQGPLRVGDIVITPFDQDHGYSRTTGYRFDDFAYSTDVVRLSEDAFARLEGIKVWVIGCLAALPHPTHAHIAMALEWIERIRPERAYITHMGPRLDYDAVRAMLPDHVAPCHDGLEFTL